MSAGWAGGSTRRWRRFRELILARDGFRCQFSPDGIPPAHAGAPGPVCGAYAGQVHHLDELAHGGEKLCAPDRAVASCRRHNLAWGAGPGTRPVTKRAPSVSRWSW